MVDVVETRVSPRDIEPFDGSSRIGVPSAWAVVAARTREQAGCVPRARVTPSAEGLAREAEID